MVEVIEGQPIMRPQTVAPFTTPRGIPVSMTIRDGTNDWNTLNACMTQDEYGLKDWSGSGWAFDIGGYLGGVGIGLALDNPDLDVVIVEPVPDNMRLIRENVERNHADRVWLVEGVVGASDPVAVWFNYSGNENRDHHSFVGNSSLLYADGGEWPHAEKVFAVPWTLERLIDEYGSPQLIKIDCEGGEWTFLDSHAVESIPVIVGEAHVGPGHRGDDIVALLAPTHDVVMTDWQGQVVTEIEGTVGFRAVLR